MGVDDLDRNRQIRLQTLDCLFDLRDSAHGKWPSYARLDKEMFQRHEGAAPSPLALHRSVLVIALAGGLPIEAEPVLPTLEALVDYVRGEPLVSNFLSLIRLVTAAYFSYQASDNEPALPSVTSDDFVHWLVEETGGLRPMSVAHGMALAIAPILAQEDHLYSSATWNGMDGWWQVTLRADVRELRGVVTLADYVEHRRRRMPPGREVSTPQEEAAVSSAATRVFVVHGRDWEARDAMFAYLRDLGLEPLEWDRDVVLASGSAMPYTGDAIAAAMKTAQAVVVLITPDDEARLHANLALEHDGLDETALRGQARPNVIYEAGMARVLHPTSTIIVYLGTTRRFTDVDGFNYIRIDRTGTGIEALASRLATAGCNFTAASEDWRDTSRFASLGVHARTPPPP